VKVIGEREFCDLGELATRTDRDLKKILKDKKPQISVPAIVAAPAVVTATITSMMIVAASVTIPKTPPVTARKTPPIFSEGRESGW